MHPTHSTSRFKTGSKVLYTSNGITSKAVILDIHFDDNLKPYYTIQIVCDGREKQTDDNHIKAIPHESRDKNSSAAHTESCAESYPYPTQQRRYDNGALVEMYCSSSDDETDDIRDGIQIKALPPSILRPSTYGTMKKRKLDRCSQLNDIAPKRVRIDPTFSSHFSTLTDDKVRRDWVLYKRRASHYKKAPSLLRPPIDKRYYMRIKTNKQEAKRTRMARQKVQKIKPSEWNDSIFGYNHNKSNDKAFSCQLSQEITAKARSLKKAQQQVTSLKRQNEVGDGECSACIEILPLLF